MSTELVLYDEHAVSWTPLSENDLHVVWEFWRTRQERSFHGKPVVVDLLSLGDVALVNVDYEPLLEQLAGTNE